MSILDSLPHLATAQKRVRVKDTLGGSKDSFINVFTDRDCWCQQAGDSEITGFQKRGINISDKVYFTENPVLNESHVLVISGQTYEVMSAPEIDASAGLGVLWRVNVNRKTTEQHTP